MDDLAAEVSEEIQAVRAMRHPNVELVDPFSGRTVEIDVEMVPVISVLWSLGMETSECCQGYPSGNIPGLPKGSPAIICFAVVGCVDPWGWLCSRYRKGKQHATRLVVLLAEVAPDDRWRTWRWCWDQLNQGSGVLLPNEDLPWFAIQLERLERATAGQLTFDEALARAR
jgi:hypothetical protein